MIGLGYSHWSAANTLVLAFSLFQPWLVSISSFGPGRPSPMMGWETILQQASAAVAGLSGSHPSWVGILLIVPFGGVCVVAYTLLSGIRSVLQRRLGTNRLAIALLGGSYLLVGLIPLTLIARQLWPPLWGYWLCLVGLMSSTAAEVSWRRGAGTRRSVRREDMS
jgi:polyferredoxin